MYNPPRWGRPSQATTSASPRVAFGNMWSGPVSTCNIHDFVLVRVIACLLSFGLFRLTTRNGSNHCIGPKKKTGDSACVSLLFVLEQGRFLTVRSMILCWSTWLLAYCFLFVSFGHTQWLQPLHRTKKKTGGSACLSLLFLCLFVCLFVWSLVCVCLVLFSFVSFSVSLLFDDQCSDKCQNLDEYFDKNRQFYHFLCVPLKPTTFGVSFPEVIMIANVFTPRKHQILWFFYKTE